MGKTQKLTILGQEIVRLSYILYGATSSPSDHIDDISIKSGLNRDLVQAAIIACAERGSHASV